MKKLSRMLCALLLAACMCACSATAEELTGEAEGYGGPLKVAVTVTDGKISQVKVTSHQETGQRCSGALLMHAGLNLTYAANRDGASKVLLFRAVGTVEQA